MTTPVGKTFTSVVAAAASEARVLRRDLHRHPELGWMEFRTATVVAKRLRQLGFELHLGRSVLKPEARVGLPPDVQLAEAYDSARRGGADPDLLRAFEFGFTAVVGVLHGTAPGPTTAIRFDLDALPIPEDATDAHAPYRGGYASVHAGCMHACGHDAHVAIGLGLARVLSEIRDALKGTVRLVFQPAEEGGRGAKAMVEAGAVDGVDHLIAIHIGMGLATGHLAPRTVGFLASAKFDVDFVGDMAHAGARPESGANALLAAAQAALGLHALPRHHAGRTRVNVGALQAGAGRNVIADKAKLVGELRGDDDAIVDYLIARARAVVDGAAIAHGVAATLQLVGRTTVADSDAVLAQSIVDAVQGVPGLSADAHPYPAYGSEDATYLMQRVQANGGDAVYCVVGSDLAADHHTPRFDIDETVLEPAIGALAKAVLALGASGPRLLPTS